MNGVAAEAFRRVTVPLGPDGLHPLTMAAAVAATDPRRGSVRVLHVRAWEPRPLPSGQDGGLLADAPDLYRETSEEASGILLSALRGLYACGVEAEGMVAEAPRPLVGAVLADAAEAWDADLIVLDRRPMGLLDGVLRRGVVEDVVRRASCPVLVVSRGAV